MNRNELLDYLTIALMHSAGFDDTTRETSPVEWNPDVDDSQYAMRFQDAEAMLGALDQLDDVSYDVSRAEASETTAMTGGLGNYILNTPSYTSGLGGTYNSFIYTPNSWPPFEDVKAAVVDPGPNVCTHVEIRHRLAEGSTLDEVHEWLEKAKCMDLPGDTVVSGSLSLYVAIRDAFVDRFFQEGGIEPVRAYGIYPQPESNTD